MIYLLLTLVTLLGPDVVATPCAWFCIFAPLFILRRDVEVTSEATKRMPDMTYLY